MKEFENLETQVKRMRQGFVIINNKSAAISNLKDPYERRTLGNENVNEFVDHLLDVKGLNFEHYGLGPNLDVIVVGEQRHVLSEAMDLLSLFTFSYLKPNYEMISAIVGIEFDKNMAERYQLELTSQPTKKQELSSHLDLVKNRIKKVNAAKSWSTIAASVVLCIVFSTMTMSLISDGQEVEAYIQCGQESLEQGNYSNALECYDAALLIDPDNKLAQEGKNKTIEAQERDPLNVRIQTIDELLENGERYSINREFGKASIHYSEVIVRQPNHVQALVGLGYAEYNMALYVDALERYEHALELDSKNVNALNGLALTHTKMKEYFMALKYLEISISIDDENTNTLNAYGIFHLQFFEYAPAEEFFLRSLEIEDKKTETLVGLATIYYRTQQFDKALEFFNLVLELKENHRDALFGLAIAHVAKGDENVGQTFLDMVEIIDKNSIESVIIEANSLTESNQPSIAIKLLDNILKYNPDNVEALTSKGNALLFISPEDALSTFEQVLKIDPVYVNGLVGKINALIEMSNKIEAEQSLTLLTKIDPENQHVASLINRIGGLDE